MKVIVTDEGMKHLKDNAYTLEKPLSTSSKSQKPSMFARQMVGSMSLPKLPQCTIKVKTPRIDISEEFKEKYRKQQYQSMLAGNSSRISSMFITDKEGEGINLAEKLEKTLKLNMRNHSLSEMEARYQKVLEKYRNNLRKQANIKKNVKLLKRVQEQQENERVEKIRALLEKEADEYKTKMKAYTGKERKKQRIFRSLGGQYSKIWNVFNLSGLAVPKRIRAKYLSLKKAPSIQYE